MAAVSIVLLTAPHQKQAEEKSKVYSCPFFFPGYLFPLFFLFCLKERGLVLIQKRVWIAQKSLDPLLTCQPGPAVVGFEKCKKLRDYLMQSKIVEIA